MNFTTENYIRQIEILARLINKERFSKADLAFLYSVSEITINRDLKELRKMGIEVFSRKGTVKLLAKPKKTLLINLATDFFSLELGSITIRNSIKHLSEIKKYNFFEIFILLSKSVSKSIITEFTYKRFYDNKTQNYKVKPIKLIQNNFNWILRGIKVNEDTVKSFYLSRMGNVKLTDKTFLLQNNQTDKTKKYKIVLNFNPEVKSEITDKIWFDNFELYENQTGFIKLITNQPITNKLAAWCISWWDAIKIENPKELQDYIAQMIEEFSKNNT